MTGRDVTLLGVPLDAGAGIAGCRMGPDALRVAGLAEALAALGHSVRSDGNVAWAPATADIAGARQAGEIIAATAAIRRAADDFGPSTLPIFLGGDHAMAIGSIAAMADRAEGAGRPLHVLWLDAHSDYNTPVTSPSGNVHGMPVAALCGEPEMAWAFGDRPVSRIPPERFHMLGIRSVDTEERHLIEERGVDVADMRAIDEHGISALLGPVLEQVAAEGAMLHLSFDLDFLDPDIAPGVGTAIPGGATYREAHLVMEMLHDSGLVTSLDLVELNPFLDERGRSALLLVDLTASLFGRKIIDRPRRLVRG